MRPYVMVLGRFGLSQAEADARVVSQALSALCAKPVHPGELVQDQGVFVRQWRCDAPDGPLEVQLVNDENVDTSFVVVVCPDASGASAVPARVLHVLRSQLRAIDTDRLLRAARESWRTEPETLMRAALDSSTSWDALEPTLVEAAGADDKTWDMCVQAMAMAPQGVAQRLLQRAFASTLDPSRRAAAQRLMDKFDNARPTNP